MPIVFCRQPGCPKNPIAAREYRKTRFFVKMGGLTAAMAEHFELVLDMMLTVRLLAAVVR